MKNLSSQVMSPKALLLTLLTALVLFTADVYSAELKVATDVGVMQQNINLNKSTVDDLVTLKGVGHKKALAIVAYRQQIGGFTTVSEIINIKGIGKKILNDNKDRLKI